LSPDAERGDADPLDICVISERPLTRAEVILTARVVGGIQAIDGGEADDKIVAVLVRIPMKSTTCSSHAVHLSERSDASEIIIPSSGRHGQGRIDLAP
jgi:inorganic pyrophosphatase